MVITPGKPPFYAHKKESYYHQQANFTGHDAPMNLPNPYPRFVQTVTPRCERLTKGMGNFCDKQAFHDFAGEWVVTVCVKCLEWEQWERTDAAD